MDWRRGACGRWTVVLLSRMGLGRVWHLLGVLGGRPPDEFLLTPFDEQIVRSQCKGWGEYFSDASAVI